MIRNKRSHNIAYRCYNIWNIGDISVESEESDVCWPRPTKIWIFLCLLSPFPVQGKPRFRDPNILHLIMMRPGLQSFRLLVSESKENAKYNDNFLNGNFLIYLISILHHSREPIKKVWKIQHFGEKGFRTGSFSTLFLKAILDHFFN